MRLTYQITTITKTHHAMQVLNYQRLTALKPTVYHTFTNKLGQEIELVEHPIKGDEAPVVILYHAEKLAVSSDFYDCNDMLNGQDYEPVYMHGQMMMTFECMNYTKKDGWK